MHDRKRIVLESVKKLLALGVSDSEIILHLKEVGIQETEARSILAEAKGLPLGQIPEEPSSKSVLEEVQGEMQEPVIEEEEKPVFFENESHQAPATSAFRTKTVPVSGNLSELWEKGILQTVNDKLQEMRRLHDEIEHVIDSKVEKSVDKEMQKMDALFKSQQTLQAAKMNAALEAKEKEVTSMIDNRIAELKKMKEEKRAAETALTAKQDLSKQTFERLSQELASVQKERNASIQEFNSELIKAKSKFEEVIEDARQKMTGLEERAAQTLELETAIIDGMVKDSQNRIDHLTIEKMDSLARDVRQALTEFEALKTGFNFEEAEKQLQRFEATRQKIENQAELAAQSLSQRMETRFEKELQPRLKSLQAIDTEIKEIRSMKEELQKELERTKAKASVTPKNA
jgi:DNA repair exonuclease SbcCD ATPase subunit